MSNKVLLSLVILNSHNNRTYAYNILSLELETPTEEEIDFTNPDVVAYLTQPAAGVPLDNENQGLGHAFDFYSAFDNNADFVTRIDGFVRFNFRNTFLNGTGIAGDPSKNIPNLS